MSTTWTSEATGTGAYADVNGLHLYYETHGEGRPMILLHGGLGSGEMFGDYESYASFADPDGNTWLAQEVPSRATAAQRLAR